MFFLFTSLMVFSQKGFKAEKFVSGKDTLQYQILYPDNFKKGNEYPVVLFLHGSGERGNNNTAQLTHGSSLFLADSVRSKYPAIVIFPQCPQDDYWSNVEVDRTAMPLKLVFQNGGEPTTALRLVMELMEETVAKKYVKKDQVYVMGLSMGGMGTFELLSRKPDMFAAGIPICGGAHPESAAAYATKIPVWVFHGAKDDVVNPLNSIDMVSSILQKGGFPQFTLYENANHNSWDPTFAQPKLLSWLFSKHNQQTIIKK